MKLAALVLFASAHQDHSLAIKSIDGKLSRRSLHGLKPTQCFADCKINEHEAGKSIVPKSQRCATRQRVSHHATVIAATALVVAGPARAASKTFLAAKDKEDWSLQCALNFLTFVEQHSKIGDWESVVSAIERFAQESSVDILSAGKAQILANDIEKFQPQNILELGTGVGYSTLFIAKSMPSTATLTSIEVSLENTLIATAILRRALAGSDVLKRIRLVNGQADDVLKDFTTRSMRSSSKILYTLAAATAAAAGNDEIRTTALASQGTVKNCGIDHLVDANVLNHEDNNRFNNKLFDYLFFDHNQKKYLQHLQFLEKKKLLQIHRCGLFTNQPNDDEDFLEYINADDSDDSDTSSSQSSENSHQQSLQWISRIEQVPIDQIEQSKPHNITGMVSVSYLLSPPLFYRKGRQKL